MEITASLPPLEESLAKFVARVAEGKATSEELAFMMKVALGRTLGHAVINVDKKDLIAAIGRSDLLPSRDTQQEAQAKDQMK